MTIEFCYERDPHTFDRCNRDSQECSVLGMVRANHSCQVPWKDASHLQERPWLLSARILTPLWGIYLPGIFFARPPSARGGGRTNRRAFWFPSWQRPGPWSAESAARERRSLPASVEKLGRAATRLKSRAVETKTRNCMIIEVMRYWLE